MSFSIFCFVFCFCFCKSIFWHYSQSYIFNCLIVTPFYTKCASSLALNLPNKPVPELHQIHHCLCKRKLMKTETEMSVNKIQHDIRTERNEDELSKKKGDPNL